MEPAASRGSSVAHYLDVSADAAATAVAQTGASSRRSLAELIESSDIVIVAVRPQHVADVLAETAPLLGSRGVVSVAAGVSLAELRVQLPAELAWRGSCPISLPRWDSACSCSCRARWVTHLRRRRPLHPRRRRRRARRAALRLPRPRSPAACRACSPCCARLRSRRGESRGLDPDIARRLAIAAVCGAAAVLARDGDPEAVIASTATPGGTTAAAVAAFEERGSRTLWRSPCTPRQNAPRNSRSDVALMYVESRKGQERY